MRTPLHIPWETPKQRECFNRFMALHEQASRRSSEQGRARRAGKQVDGTKRSKISGRISRAERQLAQTRQERERIAAEVIGRPRLVLKVALTLSHETTR